MNAYLIPLVSVSRIHIRFLQCWIPPFLISLFVLPLHTLQAEDDWDYTLVPYIWFAGIKGDVSTIPGSPVAPIEVTPGEALENSEASFMLVLAANKGQHGLGADFFYSDSRSEEELIPNLGLNLKTISKTTVGSLYYQYNLADRSLQLFAGLRYWDIDTELRFSGGNGFLAGKRIRHAEDWVDPVVGVRGWHPFGDSRFFATWTAAMGGLIFGSEYFYDLVGTVGYQWNASIATTIGYRLYDLEYEEGDFFYDVQQQGWLAALRWSF